jgi:predicted ATPase
MLACAAADGGLGRALAEEGGMPSALWAGDRPRGAKAQMRVAITLESLRYSLVCGLVPPPAGIF